MGDVTIDSHMRDALRQQWHRFIDDTAELRPQVYQYARRLTGNPWDAEDLVQDTLIRAFGSLAQIDDEIRNARSYIFRIATNLWIDQMRKRGFVQEGEPEDIASVARADQLARLSDAASIALRDLPPKQLAALLLKDVFDASLEECAEALQTSVGAVKALLHRGRGKVDADYDSAPVRRHIPSRELVDEFVSLFNAEDKEGLLNLVLDNAVAGNIGTDVEWGYEGHRSDYSWFSGSLGGHPEWPEAFRFESQRAEARTYLGEPIVLVFRTRKGTEALENVVRLQEDQGKVCEIRSYAFCPEAKEEIAAHFKIDVRAGSYRYPTPSHGRRFSDDK